MLRYPALVLLLVVSLAPVGLSHAEEEEASRVAVEVQKAAEIPLLSTIRLTTGEATVGEAFAAIQKALDGQVQFVVRQSAEDLLVSAITLNNTPVLAAVNLMGQLIPDLSLNVSTADGLRQVAGVVDDTGYDAKELAQLVPAERGTCVIIVDLAERDAEEEEIERELRIVPVGELVEDDTLKIDDIATAIETVWAMEPSGYNATLKYHPETNLLICFGTPRHLQRMEEVLEGIAGHGLTKSQVARIGGLEVTTTQALDEVQHVRAMLAHSEKQFADLRAKIKKLEMEVAELRGRFK